MIEKTTILSKKKRIPWRDFGGEVVIVDTQTLACLNLNETASFIWHLMDGSRTCRDIIGQMVDEFEVGEDAAANDFFTCAQTLLDKGFVADAAA
jgi:hypothetical protein